jgi:NAD(P)-dependent dehydrogenase (short-subunit alcohol dehydrogenase family)
LEYEVFTTLKEKVGGEIERLKKAANSLADLDVISNLAEAASVNRYTRPVVNRNSDMKIVDGRHPVLEKILKDKGVNAKLFASDASDFEQAHQVVKKAMAEFGAIHILVNNAGITRDTLLMRMTEEQWDRVLEINLKGYFNYIRRCLFKKRP